MNSFLCREDHIANVFADFEKNNPNYIKESDCLE